ncbi:MAG TPA: STAS/SEC14 domain-containing protein [Vitreimonas sp.]|uniref:STAS/SEC14 domain-containing protein n=1 Tax=Vitreimonas sp. TaxID=3069702 RepID=UPI002D54BD49|nr:STAS/SEC14 domain-containing protein [Vitreimonas sp.]HYD87580.1 STAS/SEC14 domain-containing protein [Vitreimonas sp.]
MHGDLELAIEYDAEIPCVVMIWKGYATSAAFRDGNAQVLSEINARKASKLLGDVTDFVLIGAEDQAWLNEVWIPRAMHAGLRKVALVQPNFYFNRVAVDSVAQKLDRERVEVGFFSTREEAREWLKG